jgi:hypothetical protein
MSDTSDYIGNGAYYYENDDDDGDDDDDVDDDDDDNGDSRSPPHGRIFTFKEEQAIKRSSIQTSNNGGGKYSDASMNHAIVNLGVPSLELIMTAIVERKALNEKYRIKVDKRDIATSHANFAYKRGYIGWMALKKRDS